MKKVEEDILDYATMLEIPVQSCSVTYKKSKRKKKAQKQENLKDMVIDKVNSSAELPEGFSDMEASQDVKEFIDDKISEQAQQQPFVYTDVKTVSGRTAKKSRLHKAKKAKEKRELTADEKSAKKEKRFNIVFAQLLIVCVLGCVLFLMNIFWLDANIGDVLKGVFGSGQTQTDNRKYTDFNVALPTKADINMTEGALTFSAKGGIYAPYDGVISSVTEEAGKYIVEIKHNDNFKSIIKGADLAFYQVGDSVYKAMPVAYSNGENEISVCFYDGEQLISDCSINDSNALVWTKSV